MEIVGDLFSEDLPNLFLEADRFINSRPESWYINLWCSCGFPNNCLK